MPANDIPQGFSLDPASATPGLPQGFTLDPQPLPQPLPSSAYTSGSLFDQANIPAMLSGQPAALGTGQPPGYAPAGPQNAGPLADLAAPFRGPFPYDKPGTTYGDFFPGSYDEATGARDWAIPEFIRSPVRGAISIGQKALGEKGQPGENLDPEEIGTLMALGGGSRTVGGPIRGPAPLPLISRERAALAREAIDTFNIPLTGPQIGANRTTKFVNSALGELPLSGAGGEDLFARQQWTRAVSRTFGEDTHAITQDVMDTARRRIGGEMDRIENSNAVDIGGATNALATIERNAQAGLTDQEYAVVKRLLDDVINHVGTGGTIPGSTFGNLISHGSALDNALGNANSNIASAAGAIKGALQDALQRSLSGDDLAAYRNARFQYKNMKTIEPLVNKSTDGNLSPALLNGQVSLNFPNRAFDVSGTNQLDRLAKIGQAFLKEIPSSGSAERGGTGVLLAKLGGLATAGHFAGLPLAAGFGLTALGAGRAVGTYLRSPGLANRTIETGLNPPLGTMSRRFFPPPPVLGLAAEGLTQPDSNDLTGLTEYGRWR